MLSSPPTRRVISISACSRRIALRSSVAIGPVIGRGPSACAPRGRIRYPVLGMAGPSTWTPEVRNPRDCRPGPSIAPRAPVPEATRHGHLHPPRPDHRPRPARRDPRLRGLPRHRRALGPPAHVPALRPHRLLRQLTESSCQQARRRERPRGRALGRARRGLELVLPRRGRVRRAAAVMTETLPPLLLTGWRPTKDTLHLYAQIVGKVRLAATPPRNHWWNVPLYVDVRGLTTRRMRHAATTFQIDFDLVDHALRVRTADGREEAFALRDGV